jgi:eukaryotic-like serine/threonine-protein kinase
MRDAPDALLGTSLPGGYRIVQLLKSGGVARVYVAHRRGGDLDGGPERVAIKVLRQEHASRPESAAAFERQAALASRIRHPNVLHVSSWGLLPQGLPYMTMELLSGRDLADALSRVCPLAPSRATHIAAGAASGLEAAHIEGVIHLDLKPENIFLVHAPDGREAVKVLDFGGSSGTPGYAAPELARGETPSPAADIYSLGVVLFEMLAGNLPSAGSSWPSSFSSLPSELLSILARALAPEPHARFSSMAELRNALEHLVGSKQT